MQDPWAERDPQGQDGRSTTPPQFRPQTGPAPQGYGQPQFQPARQPQPPVPQAPRYGQAQYQPPPQLVRKTGLTAAEQFWYILGCIYFGAMYFAKIPAKKAMHDFGLVEMTAAEKFWYMLMCIWFGAGYFAKIPVAKAITEMQAQATYR